MVDQGSGALYPSIGQFTDFATVKLGPPGAIELEIELLDELGINEVDKGIPNIAGVVGVEWQVEEVVLVFVIEVNLVNEHLLRVLVGDVSDHQCGSLIVVDLG